MIKNDIDLKILRQYAAGAEIAGIGKDIGVDQELVAATLSEHAGFQRGRARELVRQYDAAHPVILRPEPASQPEVRIELRTDGSRSPVETVLSRAKAAGGRYAKRAEKIREQVVALDAELAEYQQVIDAEKHVQELRRQLDEANAKLRQMKGARTVPGATVAPARSAPSEKGPTPREVREWAKANGVECGPLARIPVHVMEKYRAAHGQAAA